MIRARATSPDTRRATMPTLCLLARPAALTPRAGFAPEPRARRATVPRAASGHDDAVSIASTLDDRNTSPSRLFVTCALSATLALGSPALSPALAGTPKGQGVLSTDEYGRVGQDRCGLEALKKGASTRAAFSDFATQQNQELYVSRLSRDRRGRPPTLTDRSFSFFGALPPTRSRVRAGTSTSRGATTATWICRARFCPA